MTNPISADNEPASEKPGAPASANPMNTTLPVMFATNTRPRARMLAASTRPVTIVSTRSNAGSGPCLGSAT